MTKEEAKEYIYDCLDHSEATEVIKALEQESITWIVGKDNCQVAVRNMPIDKMQKICAIIGEEEQQPCDDCISRQVVIDDVVKCTDMNEDTMEVLEEKINTLPSVKPQRKRGKWIVVREEYKFMGGIVNEPRGCKCSNCNKVVRFKSDFCPNCGAEMRESEEEE